MVKYIKFLLSILFTIVILSIAKNVEANSIDKIAMDIYVNNSGDATVTETWNCNVSQGTEVYHPYYNIGNSQIKDLSVTDNDKAYTTLNFWNTSGTLNSKAYKCGINSVANGVELCWGISEYGIHTYTVKYTITNFVSQLTDSQMIYWTLIPNNFSNSIGTAYIKIHTDFNIPSYVGVWGYGNYGGSAYVYGGYIEMQSKGSLSADEYMTILVKFPSGTFNCSNILPENFNYYYSMSKKGAKIYNETLHDFFVILVWTSAPILIIGLLIVFLVRDKKYKYVKINFGMAGRRIPKDINYFRDIPCNKDLFRAYFIACQYSINKNPTDVLAAFVLKWIKEKVLTISTAESGSIIKREAMVINFIQGATPSIIDPNEKELYDMLFQASEDGVLEGKEFERWCSKNYDKILGWFDHVIFLQARKLLTERLLTQNTHNYFKRYTATPQLKQEALKIAGLKRYLLDYTSIIERAPMDVKLFEEYLIFAQMLGIAKEVSKDFKDLYPTIIEQSNFNSYDTIMFISICTLNGMSSASAAAGKAANSSYVGGGGGFSSGGGGGGSFGGGGGGVGGGGFR